MTTTKNENGQGSWLQGWILVACAWLSVMASMVISPILPSMTAHFSGVADVDWLISLVATLPALFVAILAIPAGYLGDKIGLERLLFCAVLVYGFAGIAPYFLNNLNLILVTRAMVGVTEAVVMTCSTALLGNLFFGQKRERFLALQTGSSPVVAIVAVALGGMAGNNDWHNAFLIYAFAFLLVAGTLYGLKGNHKSHVKDEMAAEAGTESRVSWVRFGWICLVTVFAMTAFLITIIQLPFLLTQRGVPKPSMIGFIASAATLATPLGALFFSFTRYRLMIKLAIALGLMAAGFAGLSLATDWQSTLAGAVVTNFGSGMILPLMITWALAALPAAQRSVGTGAWMSASFLGQFASPLVILSLRGITGSLPGAIMVYSFACGIFAVAALVSALIAGKAEEMATA